MAFRVEIAPQAWDDLDGMAAYIKGRGSFENSERWFNGIMDAIRSLEELPSRCHGSRISRPVLGSKAARRR